MAEIINAITQTFKAGEGKGVSARKLSAFVLMLLVIIGHVKFWQSNQFVIYFVEVLLADFAMIAALFGLTTFDSHVIRTTKKEQNIDIQSVEKSPQ